MSVNVFTFTWYKRVVLAGRGCQYTYSFANSSCSVRRKRKLNADRFALLLYVPRAVLSNVNFAA